MLIKTLIIAALIAILASLASGMLFLVKDKGDSNRTAKALTVRISLSVALFGLLMLGIFTGHIKPHGIYPAGHPVTPTVWTSRVTMGDWRFPVSQGMPNFIPATDASK